MHLAAPSPKRRILPTLAALSLLALPSCKDSTGPGAEIESTPGSAAEAAPPEHALAGDIVVRYTSERRLADGRRSVIRQTVAVPEGKASSLSSTFLMPQLARDTTGNTPSSFALGVVRVAAPAVAYLCSNETTWQRARDLGNMHMVMSGRGSVPYEKIAISVDGKPVLTIRATWRRLRQSWILTAQENVRADGATAEQYALTHRNVGVLGEDRPVPSINCNDARASASTMNDDLTSPGRGRGKPFVTRAGVVPFGPITMMSDTGCEYPSDESLDAGPCYEEQMNLVEKSALYAAAVGAAYAACFIPEPTFISKVACAGLIAAMNGAAAALAVAKVKYDECKAKARQLVYVACGCNWARWSHDMPTLPAPDTPAIAGRVTSNAPQMTRDCTGPGEGGGTGDGSGGGSITYEMVICVWEDHYDADGNYIGSYNKGCWTEPAMT